MDKYRIYITQYHEHHEIRASFSILKPDIFIISRAGSGPVSVHSFETDIPDEHNRAIIEYLYIPSALTGRDRVDKILQFAAQLTGSPRITMSCGKYA